MCSARAGVVVPGHVFAAAGGRSHSSGSVAIDLHLAAATLLGWRLVPLSPSLSAMPRFDLGALPAADWIGLVSCIEFELNSCSK